MVSAPEADELWTLDLASGQATLFSDAVAEPYGLATHPSGDVLVANWDAQNILRITPSGEGSVFADTPDRFGNVYVDAATGDVYLPEFSTGRLERMTPDGDRELVSEGVVNQGLHAVMFDDARVLYTGYVNSGEIYRHDVDGVPVLWATLPGRLGNLLWVDGQMLATSFDTHRIFAVSPDGDVDVWAGRPRPAHIDGSGEDARFESPNGLLREDATLYVTESVGRVRRIALAREA